VIYVIAPLSLKPSGMSCLLYFLKVGILSYFLLSFNIIHRNKNKRNMILSKLFDEVINLYFILLKFVKFGGRGIFIEFE
jgi:hypothetical protein